VYGRETFDLFLFINGSLGPFLIGTAVATFFTGSKFSLNEMNQVQWQTGWNGLEALLDIRNIGLGFAVLFLVRVNGLLYIIKTVDDNEIYEKSRRKLIWNAVAFLIFFLYFLASLLISDGFAVDGLSGTVTMEKFKYLHNFISMPVVLGIFLAGVVGVLYGIGISVFTTSVKGIWFTGTGTVLAVFALFLVAGFGGTSFYPSTFDLNDSLTIRNASSSLFTLKTMMFVSFIIPFVLLYIWNAWSAITRSRINETEINEDDHAY
jgi:cytochrome d ubiquinol oxidase subunit II